MSSLVRNLLLLGTLVFGAGCASTSSEAVAFSGNGMAQFLTAGGGSRQDPVSAPKKLEDEQPALRRAAPTGARALSPLPGLRPTSRRF